MTGKEGLCSLLNSGAIPMPTRCTIATDGWDKPNQNGSKETKVLRMIMTDLLVSFSIC